MIANESVFRNERLSIKVPWGIPELGWVKINVDASFCKDKCFNGIGLIIRNCTNNFGAARISSRRFASSEEGEALAVLEGDLKLNLLRNSLEWKILEYHHLDSPFHFVNLPSEDVARNIANRSILVKGIYEFWGEGSTYEELEAAIKDYPDERKLLYLALGSDILLSVVKMQSTPGMTTRPPWFPILQPNPLPTTSFWESNNVRDHLRNLQDTLDLASAIEKELEAILVCKGTQGSLTGVDDKSSVCSISEVIRKKGINLEMQESLSLEATNSLISTLRSRLEPFNVVTNQESSWEEKSATFRLANKIQKHKRNKLWRKRKRKHIAEALTKDRERFDQTDQEADEWRAREIANDIASRKVEKMKEIAKLKAKEDRERLESELELILIVEKLQELRSVRIQKLKKQGHFLPEEDDKFLERVRAAVEEEERQAVAAADTDAAKDAIATAEESRKTIRISGVDLKESGGHNSSKRTVSQDLVAETEHEGGTGVNAKMQPEQRSSDGQGYGGAYDSVANLPLEFYHYYHGSNSDMGTLIEVRRAWDAYLRPGGRQVYEPMPISHASVLS
ncbi:hypothetical protein GIB67_027821 [Kingdonia uniflora]|uniref:tRNA (guanine(10)-N(2))-methyltransferase TRMT11 N-terminal domain-containing protein n=1 Tax=Kingdonia uniflora TaxID=39325 RepID=A0A7J7MIJ4_9MAGN|nr:hypothetical protein GIB67_027821 [Kingdonia uniflora]